MEGAPRPGIHPAFRLAAMTILFSASVPAHALTPSIELTCCQRPDMGAGAADCKRFALTAEKCAAAARSFAEVHRQWSGMNRGDSDAASRHGHILDSAGNSVQSGAGLPWRVGAETRAP